MNLKSTIGVLGALWGIAGVGALLVNAILKLTPYAIEVFQSPLAPWQWIAMVAWAAWMAWAEGYRGFHQGFAPRIAARARHLKQNPRPLHILLAPLYCYGFIHATRRARIRAVAVTVAIFGIVAVVKSLPQPWRGMVDVGVILGLAMGLTSLLFFTAIALSAEKFEHQAEIPSA